MSLACLIPVVRARALSIGWTTWSTMVSLHVLGDSDSVSTGEADNDFKNERLAKLADFQLRMILHAFACELGGQLSLLG